MNDSTESISQGEPGQREAQKKGLAGVLAAGGLLGAVAASTCCLLPLILVSLGVSGAWMANLTALSSYHGAIVVVTLLFLGAGAWQVYRSGSGESRCAESGCCASTRSERFIKVMLWGATILIAAALILPYAAPYLLPD